MINKNVYIIVGVLVFVLLIIFATKSKETTPAITNQTNKTEETKSATNTTSSNPQTTTQTNKTQPTGATKTTPALKTANFPEIDFIDRRITFELEDFPNVKLNINRVVFGRGETVTSTGCSGIPNANFSTYLYPGSGICISSEKVDGSPRGIVAFHLLIENNGNIGFGGNSDTLKLHYLRLDSAGKPVYRFATPLMGLGSYYINGYSSREIILSYLVPEDQLIFNLVSGYKEPAPEKKTLNVYDFSTDGLLIDFTSKILKIIK